MSLLKRRLTATIKLEPTTDAKTGQSTAPKFGSSGKDTVILKGYRCSAAIQRAGGDVQGEMSLRIFGMPLDLMNEVSTLGRIPLARRNTTITLEAGDDERGMSVVYTGSVITAWADFSGMPEVAFQIQAQTGFFAAIASAAPTSFAGSADVATIISGIATRMGRGFINNGVQAKLSNPYFPGTLLDQFHACANAAGIDFEDDGKIIEIFPKGRGREANIPLVSADTGMVGYPTFTHSGVALTTIYNPSIGRLSLIKVESSLTPACGTWRVFSINHILESETPNGQWFSFLKAADPPVAPIR